MTATTDRAASTPPVKERFDAAGRRVLLVCVAGGFTTLLDQSVLNTSIPALRESLHAQPAHLQWIVAGYSLAFGLALIPGGRLGDVKGRKWFFVSGLALFTVVSLLSASATEPWVLVTARLLQGAGAGLVNSQMIGTLQDVFGGQLRARALGLYAVTGGLAFALGPPVGGAVLAVVGPEYGWRITFLLNVPFGLATVLLAARYLPRPRPSARHADLDLVGLLLVAALTLALMLPFVQPPGWTGWLGFAAGAVLLLGALAWWQRRYARAGGHPLIHPALIRSAPYALGTAVAMAQFGSSLAAGLVLTMFLQDGLGLSPMGAALVSLPSAVAMGFASAVAWRVVQRFGRRTVTAGMTGSALVMLAGGLVAHWAPAGPLPWLLALLQLLGGAAVGLMTATNQAYVLRHAPSEAAGVSGAILQMAQRIAAAVSISALSGVYLRATGDGGGHRAAYAWATAVCAAVAGLAVVASMLAGRAAGRDGGTRTGEAPERPAEETREGGPGSGAGASASAPGAAQAPASGAPSGSASGAGPGN
ncbi:MFS transporter [Kitasatospora sp. NPDC058201]|uniref:MFS transporter n=1 Tax=Streptomycetaceae TaxID=2062 RepID=UPI002E78147E|nr:MFS transporter [Streptomyces sp. BE303]MED7952770.1 MFS transporter [Streptomyces sp. BE303]